MNTINTLDEKFESLFEWLNSEDTSTSSKYAKIAVVFGTLGALIVLGGIAC
jgi:hypothetical protein